MSAKEQKAKEYIQEKMFPHIANANTANAMAYFTSEDLKEAYTRGWDEALKNQWISVEDRLPEFDERVLTLHITYDNITSVRIMRRIKVLGLNPNEYEWRWSLTGDKYGIIAWMPIPSFDKILEDNINAITVCKFCNSYENGWCTNFGKDVNENDVCSFYRKTIINEKGGGGSYYE